MGGMSNIDINETTPIPVTPSAQDGDPGTKSKKRSPWKVVTLIAVLTFILIGATSAYAGYNSGINQRKDAEVALVSSKAAEQFDLAVQDIADLEYQRARQRLEYIAQIDPNFPGLTEKLAVVLARINATATPTPEPTPTIAPTLDTRGVDEMFNQAKDLMFNSDWNTSIVTLLKLRKNDPTYKPVEIDGMLFLALRNRGLEKISRQADLEGGLYDLTLASRFGPLDYEAQGYISWVSMYITGASFWELDWQKVVEYFSQVGPALPGLTDRSGMTAKERFRLGLKGLGTTLATAGDVCGAAEQYQLSLSIGADPEVEALLNEAYTACQGETTSESQPESEVTPTVEGFPPPAGTIPPPVDPTAQPTTEPTPEPTSEPPPTTQPPPAP